MANTIYSINGPVISIKGATSFFVMEMVYVGHQRLVGEVISTSSSSTIIQVYESTTGLKAGDPVVGTGEAISVTLGPGLLKNIFDGIQRPLLVIQDQVKSPFIPTGLELSPLNTEITYPVHLIVKAGDWITDGDIYATLPETPLIEHRLMVPPGKNGVIESVQPDGNYRLNDTIATLRTVEGDLLPLTLMQKWPIKAARPIHKRLPMTIPLISGQRIIDTLFPIAKGGTAAVPGGFGTGKTMVQHQFAKWCDADIIVYVGCGERGNEMTQVLEEFGDLIDPKTHRPLRERTVLIANTSNMPVAAREASIYTGLAIAEYYRDMGYHVAIMADSTSRWAEALREISGRLEEMPAEEGFPAYLPSRISQFYERAGLVETLNHKEGSVTIIGAVSPQGADFSEPVTQNTKRFVRSFWALDKQLAYARHYPAINWTQSYSDYLGDLTPWYIKNVGIQFMQFRQELMSLLNEESKLMEIVKLIGSDVLPAEQKLLLEVAKLIRVGYLQQNAFHSVDTFVPLDKQMRMMEVILHFYHEAKSVIGKGVAFSRITNTGLFDLLVKMKYDFPNDQLHKFDETMSYITKVMKAV